MGMTNGQFKAFIRFVMASLEEAIEADDKERVEKLKEIMANLQVTLED